MRQTNNTKIIQVTNYLKVDVPVMRNGKPTKRMKVEWQEVKAEKIAEEFEHDGHLLYITREELKSQYFWTHIYKEDGDLLTCECQFGYYGTTDHNEILKYNKETKDFYLSSTGYNGSTGRGWGATIKRINW